MRFDVLPTHFMRIRAAFITDVLDMESLKQPSVNKICMNSSLYRESTPESLLRVRSQVYSLLQLPQGSPGGTPCEPINTNLMGVPHE